MSGLVAGTPRFRVFISYARSDLSRAQAIVGALEERGFECTIDLRDLPYGEKWQAELTNFIKAADTIVFLVSPASIASRWCKWEVAQVVLHSKRMIPIVLQPVPAEDLPPELGELHFLPFTSDLPLNETADALATVLRTDRAWIREHTQLAARATKWLTSGRLVDHLLGGKALREATEWRAKRPAATPLPSQELLEFLVASQAASQRRSRLWVGGSLGAALVFALIAGAAVWQRFVAIENARVADEQRQRAETQTKEVLNRESKVLSRLAQESNSAGNSTAAVLLAVEGLPDSTSSEGAARPHTPDVEYPLQTALQLPYETNVLPTTSEPMVSAAFDDDPNVVFALTAHALWKWDLKTQTPRKLYATVDSMYESSISVSDGAIVVNASRSLFAIDKNSGQMLWHYDNPAKLQKLNGSWQAVVGNSGNPRLIDLKTGRTRCDKVGEVSTIPVDRNAWDESFFVIWSRNGEKLAVFRGAAIDVVDTRSCKISAITQQVGSAECFKAGATITAAAFDRSELGLYVGLSNGCLVKADLEARRIELAYAALPSAIIFLHAREADVIAASEDGNIKRWEAQQQGKNPKLQYKIEGPIFEYKLTPDEHFLLAGREHRNAPGFAQTSMIHEVAVLDLDIHTGFAKRKKRHIVYDTIARLLAVSPTSLAAIGLSDGTLRIIRIGDPAIVMRIADKDLRNTPPRFSPKNNWLLTTFDGRAFVWSTLTGLPEAELQDTDNVVETSWSPTGDKVATVSADGSAKIWSTKSWQLERVLTKTGNQPLRLAVFNSNDTLLFTVHGDNQGIVWDLANGQEITSVRIQSGTARTRIANAIFLGEGRRIVLEIVKPDENGWEYNRPREIWKWDYATGNSGSYYSSKDNVYMLGTDVNAQQYMAVAMFEKRAVLFDLLTGADLQEWDLGKPLKAAKIARNGHYVALQFEEGILVYDRILKAMLPMLPTRERLQAIDSTGRVITGSDCGWEDNSAYKSGLHVWNAEKSIMTGELLPPTCGASHAALSADESRIVSFEEETIVWKVYPITDAWVQETKHLAGRCLTQAERVRLRLPSEPPRWCITGAGRENEQDASKWLGKWPYHGQNWKDWLVAADAARLSGKSLPVLPTEPKTQTAR